MVHTKPNLICAVFSLGILAASALSQTPTPAAFPDSQIRQMLTNQPDYTAILKFIFMEEKGGFGSTSKVAKLGRRLREEDEDMIFIREPGQATIKIYPKLHEFAEIRIDPNPEEKPDVALTSEELP